MELLRPLFPQPWRSDVVLIGTDAASEKVFLEPDRSGTTTSARTYARARERASAMIAVDFGLPERSYAGA
jgi:hypothetical protein